MVVGQWQNVYGKYCQACIQAAHSPTSLSYLAGVEQGKEDRSKQDNQLSSPALKRRPFRCMDSTSRRKQVPVPEDVEKPHKKTFRRDKWTNGLDRLWRNPDFAKGYADGKRSGKVVSRMECLYQVCDHPKVFTVGDKVQVGKADKNVTGFVAGYSWSKLGTPTYRLDMGELMEERHCPQESLTLLAEVHTCPCPVVPLCLESGKGTLQRDLVNYPEVTFKGVDDNLPDHAYPMRYTGARKGEGRIFRIMKSNKKIGGKISHKASKVNPTL